MRDALDDLFFEIFIHLKDFHDSFIELQYTGLAVVFDDDAYFLFDFILL